MIKKIVIGLATALLLSGCTVQMDNPFVKKVPEDQKLLRQRIASYELLEREAELVLSIKQKKHDAQEVGKPRPPGPAGPPGPRGPAGEDSQTHAIIRTPPLEPG